jgi:Protein of unknown function (DUF1552)
MFITKKHLPRRAFLRGVGATVALPLLDAMLPAATALASTAAKPQPRYTFVHLPHGAIMGQWTPKTVGKDFDITPILEPFRPYQRYMTVVSNLDHKMATSQSPEEAAGDHDRTASVFLSGAHVKRTAGQDIHAGITIDQVLAKAIGQDTPLPSLEMCIEDVGALGVCGAGYSCAYANTISWSSPTSPLPMERNPQVLFERLFGVGGTPEERRARQETQASILDSVVAEVAGLQRGLGSSDRARIDDYLADVREIERRIALAQERAGVVTGERPEIAELAFEEHAELMFDLQIMAFKTDITRIATLMLSRDLSGAVYPESGVPDGYHAISHHQDNPTRMERYAKLNAYHMSIVARFVEKLESTPDGEGSLLDHSLMLYGSPMSNSNAHDHYPLPVLLFGHAAGRFEGNRHVLADVRTPMANLFMSIATKQDIELPSFGDSTGTLEA